MGSQGPELSRDVRARLNFDRSNSSVELTKFTVKDAELFHGNYMYFIPSIKVNPSFYSQKHVAVKA